MQVTTTRTDLLSALKTVYAILPLGKKAKPILQKLILSTEWPAPKSTPLTVAGTDLETTVRVTVYAGISTPGIVCLPCRPLLDFVKAGRPGTNVTVTVPEGLGTALITTDDGETLELVVTDKDEYPMLPVFPQFQADKQGPYAEFQATTQDLRSALESVIPSAARGVGRYAMNGVLIEPEASGGPALVATDGRRLAIAQPAFMGIVRADPGYPECQGAILPSRPAARAIAKALPTKGDDDALVCIEHSRDRGHTVIGVSFGTTTYVVRAIAGEFPRYDAVVPGMGGNSHNSPHTDFALIDGTETTKALKTVSCATAKDARSVLISRQGDNLTLFAQAAGKGSSKVTLKATDTRHLNGVKPVGVDPDYLRDAIKACGSKEQNLRLSWTTPQSPIMLRHGNVRTVVMPITFDT